MGEGLVLSLMLWIASVTGYHIQSIPEIIYVSHMELIYKLYNCEKITGENEYWCTAPRKGHSVFALYNNETKTIHLRNDLSSEYSKIAYNSILLHELVHHMQYDNKSEFRCRGKKEGEAYDLQNQWLIEQGERGVEKTLNLNGLFLLMVTTCTDELYGS
jgi:hypothetical protein